MLLLYSQIPRNIPNIHFKVVICKRVNKVRIITHYIFPGGIVSKQDMIKYIENNLS